MLKGSELKGKVVIIPNNDWPASGNYGVTKLISAPVSDVQTVAYAVLDPAQSSMAVAGTYLYTDGASYIDRTDGANKTAVDGVLSDSTDAAVSAVTLDDGSLLGNKLYEVTEISGSTYTVEEININDSETEMKLGAITARIPNRNSVQIGKAVFGTNEATKIFVVDVATGDILVGDYSYLTVASKDDQDQYLNNILFEADENVLTVVYVEMAGESIVPIITYSAQESVDLSTKLAAPAIGPVPSLTLDNSEFFTASNVQLSKLNAAGTQYESASSIASTTDKYRVTFTLSAKTGYLFSDDVNVTLPAGYDD